MSKRKKEKAMQATAAVLAEPPSRWARPRLKIREVDSIPEPPRARWYAVHTRAKAERTVNLFLREAGYWTFYPQILVTTNHARSSEEIARAFLPRYVFVQVLPNQDFYTIAETPGVSCIIHGADGSPMPIEDRQMARMVAMAAPDGIVKLAKVNEHAIVYQEGEAVTVVDGPFEGHAGVVMSTSKDYAKIDFGRFDVDIPTGMLKRS